MGVRAVAVAFAAVALFAGACAQEPKSADVLYDGDRCLGGGRITPAAAPALRVTA